jgi:uncharacterized membrane protein YphA (DoxX/SURF4 family)
LYLKEIRYKFTNLKLPDMNYSRLGRILYGIGIAAYGIQQIIIRDYRPAIVPEWPLWPHSTAAFPYATGALLLIAGLALIGLFKLNEKMLRNISLALGIYFLILIVCFHIPNRLFVNENSPKHLGLWTDALKELAFSGGAFVVAGSLNTSYQVSKTFSKYLIIIGRIFFSVTLISFGIDHFYYTEFVASLVPSWYGFPVFWTYVGAVLLIGAGVAVLLGIKLRLVAFLLAAMLFIWFVTLHVPRAIATPYAANGNEVVSAFDALLFCGVALIIASTSQKFVSTQATKDHIGQLRGTQKI